MTRSRLNALRVARSLLRNVNIDPETAAPYQYALVLDDHARLDPTTRAAQYWTHCHPDEWDRFVHLIRTCQRNPLLAI